LTRLGVFVYQCSACKQLFNDPIDTDDAVEHGTPETAKKIWCPRCGSDRLETVDVIYEPGVIGNYPGNPNDPAILE